MNANDEEKLSKTVGHHCFLCISYMSSKDRLSSRTFHPLICPKSLESFFKIPSFRPNPVHQEILLPPASENIHNMDIFWIHMYVLYPYTWIYSEVGASYSIKLIAFVKTLFWEFIDFTKCLKRSLTQNILKASYLEEVLERASLWDPIES